MGINQLIYKLCTVLFALTLLLASSGPSVECANILFFVGFGGTSHRLPMEPLARALADKGHNVTFLSQDAPKDANSSNVNYFVHEKLFGHFTKVLKDEDGFDFYAARKQGRTYLQTIAVISMFGVKSCELLYEDPAYLQFLKNNKFDLVIVDTLVNECGYAITHLHNAKLIVLSVASVTPWVIEYLGVPDESSSVPEMMFHFPENMNFIQRIGSAVTPIFWKLFRHYYYFPKLDEIQRKALGKPDFPSVAELEAKMSLAFMNTHVAQEYPRSLPPNVIPVGGMSWARKAKPLPKELEDFINKGKEGFVFVSFGSNVDFSRLPAEKQEELLSAVRKLPQVQFVWKMKKIPANLPENIYTDKWLPQSDILLHPKVRAFVTHTGLGGFNEGLFGAVPLICFPVFAEQDYNANIVEQKGIGVRLEITTVTADQFEGALREVLYNDKYRNNMKRISKLFLDRPHSPVETAVWWTEYVLRHEDTRFLWPLSAQQPWWVKRQLDVWATIFALLSALVFIPTWLAWKLVRRCCFNRRSKPGSKPGKKLKRN